ncbi:MAG: hypothetical protein WCG66_06255 [bacterium]
MTHSTRTLLAIVALGGSPLLAPAQQPAATPPAGANPQKQGPGGEWRKQREFLEGLPEDVRNRFKEAREEAFKDPKIQALREKAEDASRELREAVRNAISAKDPELAEKLGDFFKTREKEFKNREKKQHVEVPGESAIQKLPPAERDRFQAAREIAKQAPAVQAAEAAMKAAQTPETRRESIKAYHKAMHEAMLTADPSIADLLDQIKPSKPDATPESAPQSTPQG